VLESSIREEASHMPVIDPAAAAPIDVSVADEVDHFGDLDLGDGMSVQLADDMNNDDDSDVAAVAAVDGKEEEA
jgi:hypothetical protein